jgi:hypothetical protein
MQPDQNQLAAANADPERPLVVLAGPGSGKTRLLTERIALLLAYQRAGGLPPGSIVTLTLTTWCVPRRPVRLLRCGPTRGGACRADHCSPLANHDNGRKRGVAGRDHRRRVHPYPALPPGRERVGRRTDRAHLSAREAIVVAALLRRVLHRYTRVGFLRPYRAVLSPDDAQQMGLLATWYDRAGRAGCRVWADLRTSTTVAAPPRRHQETAGAEPEPIVPPPLANTATTAERTDLMPDWLDAPESSIWHM